MSVVTVQMGQCGNQIGAQFFSSLVEDITARTSVPAGGQEASYCSAASERFFQTDKEGVLRARAVMVDMEPKVSKCEQMNECESLDVSCFT